MSIWIQDGGGTVLPSQLPDLYLWMDASDASTIIQSGNRVSQWNDKSGNSFACIQGIGAQQPLTNTNTLNGLNVITFDGVDDNMRYSVLPVDMVNGDNTTFVVVSINQITIPNGRIYFGVGNTANLVATMNVQNVNPTDLDYRCGATGNLTSAAVIPNPSGQLFVGFGDSTGRGLEVTGSTVSDANVKRENLTDLWLGMNGTSVVQHYGGGIAEIVSYTRKLSTDEITAIKSYLQNKWGV